MKQTQNDITKFLQRFCFHPELAGYIGIEREQFLISPESGQCVPRAPEFLKTINDPQWTYELSACQVESRTKPKQELSAIEHILCANESRGKVVATQMGLHLINREVGAMEMPLDVYPNPRYLEIAKTISRERLAAACRVTGIHVHIGTHTISDAILLHNAVLPHFESLCQLGDHSGGERLRLYKVMAEHWEPSAIHCPEHFFEIAQREGFSDHPRNCWKLIRISTHGTVELRMFGATDHVGEIMEWIQLLKTIIKEAL